MPSLLWHFSPGHKIENCAAQFLAVCWIVRVEFKVQRPCDGLSVSNARCSTNRSQRSSANCREFPACLRFVIGIRNSKIRN